MTMTMDDDGAILVHLTNPGGIVGGTGVANQITYWTDTDTIGGDPGLTYNAATDTLSLANSLTFTGATGVNDITVPDDLADVLSLDDAGGLTYLQIVSTDAQPVVRWNPASADIDFHVSATGEANALFVRGSDGNIGIGTTSPQADLHVDGYLRLGEDEAVDAQGTTVINVVESVGGQMILKYWDRGAGVGGRGIIRNFRDGGEAKLVIGQGTDGSINLVLTSSGNTGVGTTGPLARLHVDQDSGSGAIPVLYLDQADVSEEMIEFACTIGAGNAIEAVGGKALTTTHFIKVTLPGALTRYIPVGTIA
jgi:hypothetical protein